MNHLCKHIFFICILSLALLQFPTSLIKAQGVGINPAGNSPDPSSMIDVSSTTKGALMPRMTTAQRDAINAPAQSLLIYNITTKCYEFWENGFWQTLVCATCPLPVQPGAITGNTAPCQGTTQTYSVSAVPGVTYTWAFPSGWIQTGGGTTNSVTVTVGAGSGNIQVTPSNLCGSGPAQTLAVSPTTVPDAPTAGTHTSSSTQIVWNWNAVSGATGYKYNTVNTYSSATDNSNSTSFTQTGLTCNTAYTLYVWAYNSCGNSSALSLNATTSGCSQVFTYTGTNQSFTIPTGVTSATVKLWGAGGSGSRAGGCPFNYTGGGGGYATGTFTVTPGEVLTVIVGQGGVTQGNTTTYGGGGAGDGYRGSGGGRSAIRRSSTELITAGGGGGSGCSNSSSDYRGGAGGGTVGQDGSGSNSGKGGTQSAGGAGSACAGSNAGTQFQGGSNYNGGGGGYYGGGSGGDCGPYSPGAGGGSSYLSPSLTGASTTGGSFDTPGNSADPNRNGAGQGGAINTNGADGRVIISY